MTGYTGFSDVQNQIYRKSVQKKIEFTLMVVGESGLGKSTLINSLFLTDIYGTDLPGPSKRIEKTIKIETNKVLLQEKSVKLLLTIVDTPGFGDAIDNTGCLKPIVDYIDSKYDLYLKEDMKINKKPFTDPRVHCCLYFIAPGHSLKRLDIEVMKILYKKVNIVPVIGKSDTLTQDERIQLKQQILQDLSDNNISVCDFLNDKLTEKIPFAVMGSNTCAEINNKLIRGRIYPWGIVDIENENYSDFNALRDLLFRSHLLTLKDATDLIYEKYREKILTNIASTTKHPDVNPCIQLAYEKEEHKKNLEIMENNMEKEFAMKVNLKKQEVYDLAKELQRNRNRFKTKMDGKIKELEKQRSLLQIEISKWERK